MKRVSILQDVRRPLPLPLPLLLNPWPWELIKIKVKELENFRFAITRFRYTQVLFLIFCYYWGKENRSLRRGHRFIEVRYIEVPLIYCETRNIKMAKSQKFGNDFHPHKSFPGRPLNAALRKGLKILESFKEKRNKENPCLYEGV